MKAFWSFMANAAQTVAIRAVLLAIVAVAVGAVVYASDKQAFIDTCQRQVAWQLGSQAPSRYVPIWQVYPDALGQVDTSGFSSWIGPFSLPPAVSALGNRRWISAFDTTPAGFAISQRAFVVCVRPLGGQTEALLATDPNQLRAVFP